MSFLLSNFLGNGNNSETNSVDEERNKQILIEKIVAKMTSSAHLEDRKAAAQTLKSLARSHRFEIGTLALQGLIEELRRDVEDQELAKIVLETLDILCGGDQPEFCEIFLKNDENVSLLLELMGESDFYLRFTSIQILASLSSAQPHQLQAAVLNSSGGSNKILDLLQDSREIVRNEGLLLCEALVRGCADLQKIFTFQGAFEVVIQIIVEESGPWKGPLIVQDAFNLIASLLKLNTSNQIYFRDSICFKQLAGLLALPDEQDNEQQDSPPGLWNRTRISNFIACLNVLDGLLCKENVNLETSQNSALKTHFLRPLLMLAFNPKIPLEVSGQALKCLGGLIWSNGQAQHEFSREKLEVSPLTTGPAVTPPFSPLMGAVMLTLHGNPSEEASERQRNRALKLVEAFCFNNSDGQLVLLSTLKGGQSVDSPGTAILEALFDLDTSRRRDPWHCWYASALLCNLIDGNERAKKTLLEHQISTIDYDDEESGDIMTGLMLNLIRITRDSRGSTCQKSIIGYLQLLVVWLHESPMSVNKFLQEGSYIQYLIERTTTQSSTQDTEIQGLSSLILGLCVLFNDESIASFGSEALKGIIKNRIGPDLYLNRLSRLKTDKDSALISERVEGILLKNHENLMNLVARPTPAGTSASHTATLAQSLKDLTECRALLASTQSHLTHTLNLSETLKIGISERDSYIQQLQKLITEKNQKIAQMAHEMSNFEQQQQQQVQLQTNDNQGMSLSSDQVALKSLHETLKNFQETVNKQQARIEELELLLAQSRTTGPDSPINELEKWKEAYHKLYEQVQQQLNFNLSDGDNGNFDNNFEVNEKSNIDNNFETIEHSNTDVNFKVNEHLRSNDNNYEVNEHLATDNNYEVNEQSSNDTNEQLVEHHSDSYESAALLVQSDSIEVLSPSMFMSPLVEDDFSLSSGPVVIEESSEDSSLKTFGSSPELKTSNQIPEMTSEYPELKEAQETSFNAALIVSDEFARNEPSHLDEILKIEPCSISSECPPDNFLASEPDENILASKEEIKNVLDFFDKLPEVSRASVKDEIVPSEITEISNDISNIQEDFDQLNFDNSEPAVIVQPYNVEGNSVESLENEQENVESMNVTTEQPTFEQLIPQEQTTFEQEASESYNSYEQNYHQYEQQEAYENQNYNETNYTETEQNGGGGIVEQEPVYPVENDGTTTETSNQDYYSNSSAINYTEGASQDYYKDYYTDNTVQQVISQANEEYNYENTTDYPIVVDDQLQQEQQNYEVYGTQGQATYEDPTATSTASQEQQQEYYYYDEATGFTYGFDQNMNQYYYYDPNTGEYTYYTAEAAESATDAQPTSYEATATAESSNYNYHQQYYGEGTSEASSNPSLFDTTGPPLVPLQAKHEPSTLSSNFVPEQVYNL